MFHQKFELRGPMKKIWQSWDWSKSHTSQDFHITSCESSAFSTLLRQKSAFFLSGFSFTLFLLKLFVTRAVNFAHRKRLSRKWECWRNAKYLASFEDMHSLLCTWRLQWITAKNSTSKLFVPRIFRRLLPISGANLFSIVLCLNVENDNHFKFFFFKRKPQISEEDLECKEKKFEWQSL